MFWKDCIHLDDYYPYKVQVEQRTCEANPAGENNSFIFTVCVKSVLAYLVLHMAVKEFFETRF